jgi:DNA-binding NarL/FixJ family response regulator
MDVAGRIRLLIVDGQPIVLEGLRSVLSPHAGIEIVGEAVDGIDAIEKAVQLDPDVLLMDVKLPRIDGLTVIRNIQTRAPRCKIILFASSESRDDFVEAMKLGCCGILLKEASPSLIEKSILRVHGGEIWLDSNTTAAVMLPRAILPLLTAMARPLANAPN